jgi:ferredoxin
VPKVHFLNELVTAEVAENTTLREAAMRQGIELYRGMWTHVNCLGNGICGRCRVWVLPARASVSRPSLRERFHRVKGEMRLACQLRIVGDVEVRTRPIGPTIAVAQSLDELAPASYKAEAERRYAEAREIERLEVEKKAAEAEKKAAEAPAPATAVKPVEEAKQAGASPGAGGEAKPS